MFSYIYRTSPTLGDPHFHVDAVDRAGIGGNHGRIISPLADRPGRSGTVRGGRREDGQLGVALGGRPTEGSAATHRRGCRACWPVAAGLARHAIVMIVTIVEREWRERKGLGDAKSSRLVFALTPSPSTRAPDRQTVSPGHSAAAGARDTQVVGFPSCSHPEKLPAGLPALRHWPIHLSYRLDGVDFYQPIHNLFLSLFVIHCPATRMRIFGLPSCLLQLVFARDVLAWPETRIGSPAIPERANALLLTVVSSFRHLYPQTSQGRLNFWELVQVMAWCSLLPGFWYLQRRRREGMSKIQSSSGRSQEGSSRSRSIDNDGRLPVLPC